MPKFLIICQNIQWLIKSVILYKEKKNLKNLYQNNENM